MGVGLIPRRLKIRCEGWFKSIWSYLLLTAGVSSGRWLTKVMSRCLRNKHGINKNTPVITWSTPWWEQIYETVDYFKNIYYLYCLFSLMTKHGSPLFCYFVVCWNYCHYRRLNRRCRVSKYLTVWPDPWWWAVGILESHFLVFKRASFLLWLQLPLYYTHCTKHCFTGSPSVY